MAYPTAINEFAMDLYREYPDMQARQILDRLKIAFPGQPLPDIRTISGWRQKPHTPRPAKQKSLLQQFLGTHHPADVAAAIEVHLGHLLRRAQVAPNAPLRLKYHPEPDAYQMAILESIGAIDPAITCFNKEFELAVGAGEKEGAVKICEQLTQGLKVYTTSLKR